MKQHTWPMLLAAALVVGCTKGAPPAPPVAAPPAATITTPNPTKESLNDAAFAQLKAQNWPEAIRLAQRAVALDANFAPARFNLGLALYRAQRYEEAAPHLEAAYQLNKAQVEPGWFLYLTLDALGDRRAATILAELQTRFPDDPDVKKAAEAGALVWPRSASETVLLFLGDRELLLRPGGVLEMRGYPDQPLWTLRLNAGILGAEADPTGSRALILMKGAAVLVDLTNGANLGPAPAAVTAALADKSYVIWRGDLIYTGMDEWGPDGHGGGRYIITHWSIHRLVSDGKQVAWQPVGTPFTAGQTVSVSKDGHTAFAASRNGRPYTLLLDGKEVKTFTVADGMTVMGDAYYSFSLQNEIVLTSFDGKPLAGWRAPAGLTFLRAWNGADVTWFVATPGGASGTGYVVVTDHGQVAFQGEGDVVRMCPGYLLIGQGGQLQLVDGAGKSRLTFPGSSAEVTPDGHWAYTTSDSEFRAYRLP